MFVYMNQSTPGHIAFAAPVTVPFNTASSSPEGVTIADLDGDNHPDVIVIFQDRLTVMQSDGQNPPGFVEHDFSSTFSTPLSDVVAGDLNGDGKPDVVIRSGVGTILKVFLNTSSTGALSFAGSGIDVIFNTGPNNGGTNEPSGVHSLALADVNHDGRPDITVTDVNKGLAVVAINQITPGSFNFSFSDPVGFSTGGHPASVFVVDMTGDSRPDLLVGNESGLVQILPGL